MCIRDRFRKSSADTQILELPNSNLLEREIGILLSAAAALLMVPFLTAAKGSLLANTFMEASGVKVADYFNYPLAHYYFQ